MLKKTLFINSKYYNLFCIFLVDKDTWYPEYNIFFTKVSTEIKCRA